jgi:uncharacterized protein YndB with AHSA1/START domain
VHEDFMAHSQFAYAIFIRTTPPKLWQALTDPKLLCLYWCATHQESEWARGADWRLMIPDGRVGDSGKILDIEPEKKLVLSWRNEFRPELREEGYSRMTYQIEPARTSVKLSLLHEMDRSDSKFIDAVSQGRPMILSSLKTLLETGEPLEETRSWPKGM